MGISLEKFQAGFLDIHVCQSCYVHSASVCIRTFVRRFSKTFV